MSLDMLFYFAFMIVPAVILIGYMLLFLVLQNLAYFET